MKLRSNNKYQCRSSATPTKKANKTNLTNLTKPSKLEPNKNLIILDQSISTNLSNLSDQNLGSSDSEQDQKITKSAKPPQKQKFKINQEKKKSKEEGFKILQFNAKNLKNARILKRLQEISIKRPTRSRHRGDLA